MAGAQTNIEIDLNGLDRRLLEIARQISNFQTPLQQAGTHMETTITRRFSNNSWAPLKESTIARHPHRLGGKPLNDIGDLKKSITTEAKQQIMGNKLYYGFGTGIKYGATHHFGRGPIPARPFLHFDSKDERAIKRIFEDYIRGVAERG